MKFKGHLVHLKDKAAGNSEDRKNKQTKTFSRIPAGNSEERKIKKPFPEHQTQSILAERPAHILLCPPFKVKRSIAIHQKTHL